jgi:putative sigma-54 modulation protein
MNLIVSGKQLELTEALKALVATELSFLEEILPEDKTVTVTLESKPEHKATILFYHEQDLVKMTEVGEDLYEVFPRLAKKTEKHLRGFSKMKRAFVRGRHEVEDFVPMNSEDEDFTSKPAVTKRKRFEMKPMSEAEAILQMNSLAHEQFIFANAEMDGCICLLYTRKDATFGVIETTF